MNKAATLKELVEHIVGTHHAYLKRELPELEAVISEILRSDHAQQHQSLAAFHAAFRQFRREIENHLRKEEEVLFPILTGMETAVQAGLAPPRQAFGSVSNPIAFMEQEHKLAEQQLDKMRELTGNYACPSEASEPFRVLCSRMKVLEEDLAVHSGLEDRILFPKAIELEAAGK